MSSASTSVAVAVDIQFKQDRTSQSNSTQVLMNHANIGWNASRHNTLANRIFSTLVFTMILTSISNVFIHVQSYPIHSSIHSHPLQHLHSSIPSPPQQHMDSSNECMNIFGTIRGGVYNQRCLFTNPPLGASVFPIVVSIKQSSSSSTSSTTIEWLESWTNLPPSPAFVSGFQYGKMISFGTFNTSTSCSVTLYDMKEYDAMSSERKWIPVENSTLILNQENTISPSLILMYADGGMCAWQRVTDMNECIRIYNDLQMGGAMGQPPYKLDISEQEACSEQEWRRN